MRNELDLQLRGGPFLTGHVTTSRVMVDVCVALALPTLAAGYFFGLGGWLILAASVAGAAFVEWLFDRENFSLRDGSVVLTGLVLGLTLPPTLPLWMAFLGGFIAIGFGRKVFGGLGNNMFNPALIGRAFLQAAFPTALTTWRAPGNLSSFFEVPHTLFALPLMKAGPAPQGVDVVTGATPLSAMKFDKVATDTWALFSGNTSGSLGETMGILILLGGVYLLVRRAFDWRIPVGILASVAVFAGVLHGVNPVNFATPWFMLGSGGLLFGAVFMATDPVTSPMAPKGAWIFAAGIGLLVVLIRIWGGLPEGTMYAILLMNAAVPLIDRFTQPTPFGRKVRA